MKNSYAIDYDEASKRAIETMIAARAELHSGIFRASGRNRTVPADGGEPFDLANEVYCVFDTLGGRLRFERRGQCNADIRSSKGLTPEVYQQIREKTLRANPRPRDLVAMFVRTQEYSAEWYAIGKEGEEDSAIVNVEIREPSTQPNVRQLQPFHPSAVGLFDPSEYLLGMTASEIVEAKLEQYSRVELKKLPDGILEIVFSDSAKRRTIEIDPAKGFTVRRMRTVALDESGRPISSLKLESSATWKLIDGVWVPDHFITGYYSEDGKSTIHQYDIEWDAVNPEILKDDLFAYQSFKGVWDNIYVIERRGDQRVHVDTFGRPFEPMGMPQASGLQNTRSNGRSTMMFSFILVNVIAIIAILIYLRWRRVRNANSQS